MEIEGYETPMGRVVTLTNPKQDVEKNEGTSWTVYVAVLVPIGVLVLLVFDLATWFCLHPKWIRTRNAAAEPHLVTVLLNVRLPISSTAPSIVLPTTATTPETLCTFDACSDPCQTRPVKTRQIQRKIYSFSFARFTLNFWNFEMIADRFMERFRTSINN